MISNYGIYNNHELDNTLLVLFSDAKETSSKHLSSEMEVLYDKEEIIGYRISNFIRYAKIKYSGIIFLPSRPLIDVINNILENHDLETLGYKKESGYVVKMNENRRMVYAKEGIFLRDGHISKGEYCTYFDLFIENDNDKELIVIDEDIKEGIDFFKMEEK